MLVKKIDLYISREYELRYPAVRNLGISVTNAVKKYPSYLEIDIANFVVIDKPKYNLILGNLLFSDFTATDSDGEIIITKNFKHHKVMRNLDLNTYYDLEYTEIESEYSNSKDENENEEIESPIIIIR
ncbi:2885_t:CDS:2 [Funneliformis mosseae]|uniref:2885_t:CDS:1 n=1 Tax=Funneliformis mosseae TaxID=27381 RepID=A0A9N9D0D0_FUNMO|nr:2885_t:CDS:2 [Funneliformis mosseae]